MPVPFEPRSPNAKRQLKLMRLGSFIFLASLFCILFWSVAIGFVLFLGALAYSLFFANLLSKTMRQEAAQWTQKTSTVKSVITPILQFDAILNRNDWGVQLKRISIILEDGETLEIDPSLYRTLGASWLVSYEVRYVDMKAQYRNIHKGQVPASPSHI